MGQSRVEDILEATINTEPYNEDPQSRIEELLIELKETIEQGGGGGGTTVIPNPSGEATDDLEKVQIGSTIFDIPEGGTDVEANPSGTATDDLESIRIGNDIFSIPQGGGSGGDLERMSLSDYNNLTPEQKNDGTARFIPHSEVGTYQAINMATQGYYENPGNMNVDDTTSTKTTITWGGGVQIGCSYYYTTPIDVTNWDKISLDIQTGSCYGGGATAQNPAWDFIVGLLDYAISAAVDLPASSSAWKVVADLPASNHDYSGTELDVSRLTGELYLTVICHGWNATVENIQLQTEGNPSQIKYMDETYGNPTAAKVQRTTLFEGNGTTAEGTRYELPDSIFNYDYIHITVQNSAGSVDSKLLDTKYLSVGDIIFAGEYNGLEAGWSRWTITSGTVLTSYDGGGTTVCKAIIGIKL